MVKKNEAVGYRAFREQVNELLKKRCWFQADLARAMDVTPGRISHIFRGDEAVTKETIEKVAEVLNVSPNHFDLYIRYRLFELGTTVPALIDIGRSLSNAKTRAQMDEVSIVLNRFVPKIAS